MGLVSLKSDFFDVAPKGVKKFGIIPHYTRYVLSSSNQDKLGFGGCFDVWVQYPKKRFFEMLPLKG